MNPLYDYTECDEIADNMAPGCPRFASFDEAARYVRAHMMPDESPQVVDNVAEAIYLNQAAQAARDTWGTWGS